MEPFGGNVEGLFLFLALRTGIYRFGLGGIVKKEGSAIDSWLDPTAPRGELAVRFDRETGTLKLVRNGEAVQRRGYFIMIMFWSMIAFSGGAFLFASLLWDFRSLWFWWGCLASPLPLLILIHHQEVEIDTRTRRLLRRVRWTWFPWTMTSWTTIRDSARFIVDRGTNHEGPDGYVLYFVPYPDAWFTFWRPMPIGTMENSEAGKATLERLAFGLNRFLDAVRKGEPNLERLAQPAPPGPFKP